MAGGPDPGRRTLLDRVSGNAGKIAAIAGAVSAVIALWPGELWDRAFAKPDVTVAAHELQNPPAASYAEQQAAASGVGGASANGAGGAAATGVGGASANGPDTAPRVNVTLENSGRKDLRIDRVVATVEDYAGFSHCATGSGSGDIPESPPTTVVLDGKLDPRPSARVDKIVRAGDTHRFAIRLAEDDPFEFSGLYALRLTLQTDYDPIDLGRYVVAFPNGFDRLDADTFPISGQHPPLYGPRYTVADTWCYRSNWAGLQRLLKAPGQRSPETARLAAAQLSPAWARRASPATPGRAIPKLLKSEGAPYALQAAAESSDPAAARKLAIAGLLARINRELESSPAWAAHFAEALYNATGDPEHRKLVDRARLLSDQELAELQAQDASGG